MKSCKEAWGARPGSYGCFAVQVSSTMKAPWTCTPRLRTTDICEPPQALEDEIGAAEWASMLRNGSPCSNELAVRNHRQVGE